LTFGHKESISYILKLERGIKKLALSAAPDSYRERTEKIGKTKIKFL